MYVNTKQSPFFVQSGNTPLLAAAFGGSVEVVRMLLKEFNSSLDEVDNVSVSTPAYSKYYVVTQAFHYYI